MQNVNMIMEMLHENGQFDAFEELLDQDFVNLVRDATKVTLLESIRQAQNTIYAETRVIRYCLNRLAELDGPEDEDSAEDEDWKEGEGAAA